MLAPAKLENIFRLHLKTDEVPENIEIEKIGEALPNVEELSISGNGFNLGLISSFKQLKSLKLIIDRIPKDFEMEKIGHALPNIEELFVKDQCRVRGENFNFELILALGFRSLKTLKIEVDYMDFNSFLDTLRSIEKLKASNLFVSFSMNGKICWGAKWSLYDKELDERCNFVQGLF